MSQTYFPIFQCKLCTERIKRTDIQTKDVCPGGAIETFLKRSPRLAHLDCKGKGEDVHGLCELVGVYQIEGFD